MGNELSSKRSDDEYSDDDTATDNGKNQKNSVSKKKHKYDENTASFLIDNVCSNFTFYTDLKEKRRRNSFGSFSEEEDDDDDDSLRDRKARKRGDSYNDDYSADDKKKSRRGRTRNRKQDDDTTLDGEEEDTIEESTKEDDRGSVASAISTSDIPSLLSKPLASSFAKKCYFTKSGIGKKTQHYEGLTLNGNVVLMLASAMQLKGCPTICDEDLRRVEQTYPNQFSRLPDELLLSSGWRRISKFCHFSYKPIPDGTPFFHSKERLHPQGGYYFLLASAVGMVRPLDVEPINRDTLVVLETDFAAQCDAAPPQLIHDPDQWTLVEKFCFFSGGPINTEEDVYYVADFEGNDIYMLAFLSPSLTAEELYRIGPDGQMSAEHGLKSVAAVEEVESVYDLTERDFDDLKLYHLGPCRALPAYILMPQGWTKVLPPHFMKARQMALDFARDYEMRHNPAPSIGNVSQYGEMAHSSMTPHMNDLGGSDYDPYNQQPQWQQVGNQDQPYPRDPTYGNMQMQDGNYYVGQAYRQDGINNQDQPFQPNQQTTATINGSQPKFFDPEVGYDSGAYNVPNSHDQRNRDSMMQASEAARHAREVAEEGAFGASLNTHSNMSNGGQQMNDPQSSSQLDLTSKDLSESSKVAPATPPRKQDIADKDEYDKDTSGSKNDGSKAEESGLSDTEKKNQQRQNEVEDNNPYENDENRSPSRLKSVEDAVPYRDLSPKQSSSFVHGSPDRGFRDHEENSYYTEEERGGKFVDEYDDYGENALHVSQHEVEEGYEDGYHYPLDKFNSSEPDPSVDGLSSVGDYTSPESNPYKIHTKSSQYSSHADDMSPRFRNLLSPSDSALSDYTPSQVSHSSHAMRGAQEILRRNRLKRLAESNKNASTVKPKTSSPENSPTLGRPSPSIRGVRSSFSKESEGQWESSSEVSGSIVSNSSIWTDTSMADRTSRRALILQMAKARMKSGKTSSATTTTTPSKVGLETEKSENVDPIEENEDKEAEELDFSQELD